MSINHRQIYTTPSYSSLSIKDSIYFFIDLRSFQINQLSQFWYNNETATRLMNEVIAILPQNGKCACIACPTVWSLMRKEHPEMDNILFEYDTRFSTDSNSFIEYDYNDDDRIEQNYFSLKHTFDVLIIDPPFLSRECFEKVSRLVKFIGKTTPQCKHIICTGAIQEENIKDFFPGAYRVLFQPQHERNLMNPTYSFGIVLWWSMYEFFF
ncbi:unnamed protein product [Rotaria magnacalcarata]